VRIAWFTPCSSRSAIGEFSRHVTAALAEHADVDLWTADEPPWHPTTVRVVRFAGNGPLDGLRDYDAAFYNVGNYLPFHRDIHRVSLRHPGIVILHDRVLHHFFAGIWEEDAPHGAGYLSRMSVYYGAEGTLLARGVLAGERTAPWECDDAAVRYPLE